RRAPLPRGLDGRHGLRPGRPGAHVPRAAQLMDRFIVDHAVAFATWGEPALWALAALSAILFVVFGFGHRFGVAMTTRRRLIGAFFLTLGLVAGLWLWILRGPFHPFMETTRRLHQGVGRPVPEIVFQRLPDGAPAR